MWSFSKSFLSAMDRNNNVRVLFVCLGNICRSPMAEAIFQRMVSERGLEGVIQVDSVGTGSWHIGERPDRRMRATAKSHGLSIDHLRGRRIDRHDLQDFDVILAMDGNNFDVLRSMDSDRLADEKIRLFREFDPIPDGRDVPDPYWSGSDGFELVFGMIERTSASLLDWVIEEYQLSPEV